MTYEPWKRRISNPNYIDTLPRSPIEIVMASPTTQPIPIPKRIRPRWCLGITTCPREEPTLARTLESIHAAGFPKPRIFADGPDCLEIPAESEGYRVTWRDSRIGGWPNFYLGLTELVMRDPTADFFFMLQDDVELTQNVRHYIDSMVIDGTLPFDAGVMSLYCSSRYDFEPGFEGFHPVHRGWSMLGAVTLIIPRDSARRLLSDKMVMDHRYTNHGLRAIDAIVGMWCKQVNRPSYFHTPALAQHVGDTSTIHFGRPNEGQRRAKDFRKRIPLEAINVPVPEDINPSDYAVTVILPVRDAADQIRPVLDSLLAQTGPTVDIVVVDDGSTDGTRESLRDYTCDLNVVTGAGRGLHSAADKGLLLASREFVFRAEVGHGPYESNHLAKLIRLAAMDGSVTGERWSECLLLLEDLRDGGTGAGEYRFPRSLAMAG